MLGAVVDNLKLDIGASPEYVPYIGAALARRMPIDVRPLVQVDTLDVPDSMRGTTMKLVKDGAINYSVLDAENDTLILRGTVGQISSRDLPETGKLSLFISKLQGEDGQVFWIWRVLARAQSRIFRVG